MNAPSVDLLKSLENKLRSANIRSPYLRAVIGRSRNRLDYKDLALLNTAELDLVKSFSDQLLDGEKRGEVDLTLRITSESAAEKTEEERFKMDVLITRLKNIHFDQEEDFLEHGTRSFGFGFPLIALKSRQDKNRTLLAPLFVWSLDIAPLPNNHNAFQITRSEDHPIQLNPQLAAFLQEDYGYTLEKIPEEYFDNACLTEEEIALLIKEIAQLLNAKEVSPDEGVVAIQDLKYYERMVDEQPLIFQSGIFSLFKSNRESIASDYEKMIQGRDDLLFDDPNIYQPYQKDYFSAVQLDPSQESILRNISDHKKVIIQGPPGTGKSNSLTGIILNALENSAKVLVVCEKRTALEVILENLAEKGLEEFCMVLDNVSSDRQKMVKALRDRFDDRKYQDAGTQGYSEYQNSKDQFQTFYERLHEKYGNLLAKVLGNITWKEAIGNFLAAKRKTKDIGDIQVKSHPNLNEPLFFSVINAVKESSYLRQDIGKEKVYYDELNDALFQPVLSMTYLQELEEKIQNNFEQVAPLAKSWMDLSSRYSMAEIKELMQPSFGQKLKAIFSSNLKKEQQSTKELVQKSSDFLSNTLGFFQKNVSATAPLEAISEAVIQFNEALDGILKNKQQFRRYYAFRHFVVKLEEPFAQTVIAALDQWPTENWEALFRQWFFNQILMEKELELGSFPTDDQGLLNLKQLDGTIDRQQCNSIREIWYFHQRKQMESRTLQSVRLTFNLRGNKTFKKRNSLRYLMHEEFDLITAFFPVVLVNPSVCSSVFPLKKGLFDLVIFDEASQLRLEDTFPALLRGRFQVISGDIHQMPPANHFSGQSSANLGPLEDLEDDVVFSEEESLLTYAQNADFEFNYLDFHYRSQHPHLIDFSNAAFYGKRLVPMPASYHGQPIVMREVGGIYEDNKNDGEANEIIKILFEEIQPNEKGEFPSIGVATLNMTQQRYLWERIWQFADQDETARTRLAQLEAAGFFIKNLENIQGDQRDIIIISTTFGVRPDGRFIQNFGPLNQEKGYKLLNVIVTRAKQQIYLITSIPNEFYSNFRSDIVTRGKTGKGIFYAYLNYAKFCAEGNEDARLELLSFLMEDQTAEAPPNTTSADNFLTESPFEEEVIHALLSFVPAAHIATQFQMGGFRLDIVIKDLEGFPKIVIECDGKTYHSSKVAYRYDIHRQNILERHGLKVYRIWSTNWWREKDREVMKMRRYLEEHLPEALSEKQ